MAYPPVVVVDAKDQIVGESMLADAWEKGLIYRLVYVLVEDDSGRLLLQRRPLSMHLQPGRWDVSAAGHVDVDPDYEATAKLELDEEIGLKNLQLTEVAYFYSDKPFDGSVKAKRFAKIFRAKYNGTPQNLAEDEVSEVKWFDRAEITELLQKSPDLVAEGLMQAYNHLLKNEDHVDSATSKATG